MRQGGGKSKGNAYERKIARALSGWLTGGQDPNQLIWSVGSGGWRSKAEGDQGWRQVGDLAPNGEAGEFFRQHFAVECKHYQTIDFWHVLTAKPGQNLHGWWVKLVGECEPYPGIAPMLIVQQNRRPTIVGCLGLDTFDLPGVSCSFGGHRVPFVLFEDFLRLTPEQVFSLSSR